MSSKAGNYKLPEYDLWESENLFYLKSDPSRINKFITHYEIYKMIKNLPGQIIECGVYKGCSLMRFVHFRNILETTTSRTIFGFDYFGTFQNNGLTSLLDKKYIERFNKVGPGISEELLTELLEEKKISNVKLVKGNVLDTLGKFVKDNPNLKIALLHLDMDVYEPTMHALKILAKHIVQGGLIVIDDYATVEGATRAVDEYINGTNLKIQKLSTNYIPSYIEIF